MYSLAELAELLGLAYSGDGQKKITGLASLQCAGPDDLSFHTAGSAFPLVDTRAGAVIVAPESAERAPCAALVSTDAYLSFARASRIFDDTPAPVPGVHPGAWVADGAVIAPSASVAAGAVVEEGVTVARDVAVGAGAFIGRHSVIGAGSVLHPRVVICAGVRIGEYCVIHSQSVVGSDGFGFASGPKGWERIHQTGGVVIGDGVDIGACTSIDRGTLDDTVIEDGVIIDNQVQVGHNCRIGAHTAIAGCVGIAGSTVIGANCTLAGGVGVVGHVEICDNVHITGMTMVTRSIREPGAYSSGTPMRKTARWKRSAARFAQLDAMHRRLAALEKRLDESDRGSSSR